MGTSQPAAPKLPEERCALLEVVRHLRLADHLQAANASGFSAPPWDLRSASLTALDALDILAKKNGLPAYDRTIPSVQPFRTKAVAAFLNRAGDPDAPFYELCRQRCFHGDWCPN